MRIVERKWQKKEENPSHPPPFSPILLMLPTPIITAIPLLLLLLFCSNNDDEFNIKNNIKVPNTPIQPTTKVFVVVNNKGVNITKVKIGVLLLLFNV